MKLIVYTSWFRPNLGRDSGEMLCLGLERRGHELVGVIGHHKDEEWSEICHKRGWKLFPTLGEFSWPSQKWIEALRDDPQASARLETWLAPLRKLDAELGLSYFATWLPPDLCGVPRQGFINFHPAPLPQYRGFFPEDLLMLEGKKSSGGTLHKVTPGIDQGDIFLFTKPGNFGHWDTPDSASQKISEAALPDIWRVVDLLEKGKISSFPQNPALAFNAGYEALYAHSRVNWLQDNHEILHRKFQVFRGQAHRMVLKASWSGEIWTVWDWELHTGDFVGTPGDFLGTLATSSKQDFLVCLVRTVEGICVVWDGEKFEKEPGSGAWVDQCRMHPEQVLSPGPRPRILPRSALNPWRRKKIK